VEGHVFVHAKHETLCFSWWNQKHPKWYCEIHFIPHHGGNKEGKFPLNVKVGHKCNKSTWELKDGGGSTQCVMQRKKHLGLKKLRNGCVICLKWSLDVDIFLFLQTTQKGEHKTSHLTVGACIPTWNVFKSGTN